MDSVMGVSNSSFKIIKIVECGWLQFVCQNFAVCMTIIDSFVSSFIWAGILLGLVCDEGEVYFHMLNPISLNVSLDIEMNLIFLSLEFG